MIIAAAEVERRLWSLLGLWSILHNMAAMKTVQIVMDGPTLAAADRAARRRNVNRSQLVREAVRHYLATKVVREVEAADRAGYERLPQSKDDLEAWDAVQRWPAD